MKGNFLLWVLVALSVSLLGCKIIDTIANDRLLLVATITVLALAFGLLSYFGGDPVGLILCGITFIIGVFTLLLMLVAKLFPSLNVLG